MESLQNSIREAVKDIYPFYMPGHKQNKRFFPFNLADIDVTEIEGTDNLHNPRGIILESMRHAAKIYGADETLYLVNGSSGGVIASILAAVAPDGEILIARNTHKSVYTGLIFSGARPRYILTDITADGLQGGISPITLDRELEKYPNISAVYVTSPTFEGFVSDIAELADIAHSHNCLLIVDEAHGAHFPFSDYFPKSAIQLGADIIIQSLHKTLPTLTQSAIIHINGNRVDAERLKYMLTLTQSTSPSYIFMAVADYAIRLLSEDRSIFRDYVSLLKSFRQRLRGNKHIRLLGEEQSGKSSIHEVDLGRLCFCVDSASINGRSIEIMLRYGYKIQIEYSGLNYIIAITSPADTKEGFDRLASAIEAISSELPHEASHRNMLYSAHEPIVRMTPREAFYSKSSHLVPLEESYGHVSYGFVIPYPPGIPILAPGEEITPECVKSIQDGIENDIEIVGNGLKGDSILVC